MPQEAHGGAVLNCVNVPVAKSRRKKLSMVEPTESASQKLLTFRAGKLELQLPAVVQSRTRGSSASACRLVCPVTGYLAATEVPRSVQVKPSIVSPPAVLNDGWGPGPEVPAAVTFWM